MAKYRIEQDSMGEVRVSADALYGAQAQRARDNFALEQRPLPAGLLCNFALVKSTALGSFQLNVV